MTAEIIGIAEKVPPAPKLVLAGNAAEIRQLSGRGIADVVRTGQLLIESKKILEETGGPTWAQWLEQEFDWSDQTAYHNIYLYELSQDPRLQTCLESNPPLPLRLLYRFAAPSAEDARQEIADRIATGEEITRSAIEEAIDRYSAAPKPISDNTDSEQDSTSEAEQAQPTGGMDSATAESKRDSASKAEQDPATEPEQDSTGKPEQGPAADAPVDDDGKTTAEPSWSKRVDFFHQWLWHQATFEERAALIQRAPIEGLLAAMSAEQREEFLARLIGQQIANASAVNVSASSKNLLTNLTGTLHWALGREPADGVEALKIISGKLKVNKRSAQDIVLAWAKPCAKRR
jgi:hypothetical protein